jgi:MFS family permease
MYVSLQIASQGIAMILAGSLGLALSLMLTVDQMLAWGWRVPFLASVALIPIALFLRTRMPETLAGEHRAAPAAPAPSWRARPVVLGILVIAGGTVSTYVGNYMTTYGTVVLKLPPADGFQTAMLTGLATLTGATIGGHLADRLGHRSMILWPRLIVAAIAIPAFDWLAAHPDGSTLQAISATLAFLTALTAGGVLTAICELFPPHRRAAGLAMVYSIGVSVFGGSTQPAVTLLIAITGSPLAPAWCIAATSGVAIIATLALFGHRQSEMQRASTGA